MVTGYRSRVEEQHDVTGAYRSAWERDTGMQECCGEGRGNVDTCLPFPFPLPLPLPLSLSLSLCLLSGDRFVLKQSTLAFAQDDKAYRLVGRIDVARDRASIRSDRVYLPASGWWLLRNFVLRDIRQGNESSSFRRTNANGETNGVRGDEFESCKGLSFFSRSLIKTCWI